jgi:23S rRNA (guanosine2251-2'-O)-methyltransferase
LDHDFEPAAEMPVKNRGGRRRIMARKRGDMETNFEVRSFDAEIPLEEFRRLPRAPLWIVLDNLRSAFNVGAIFRLCDTMRAAGLYLCGYTAHPPNRKLEKTSLGTIDYVPWRHFEETEAAVRELQERGIPVWAVETSSHAVRYDRLDYPSPLALVFGNEALGVSREVLERCTGFVEIPTWGFKNSLNVATSVAVVGYRALDRSGFEPAGSSR